MHLKIHQLPMPNTYNRDLTPKEQEAKRLVVADRLERINEALDDITNDQIIVGRAAEDYLIQAQEVLTAAVHDLK